MSSRVVYTVAGLMIGGVVDIILNLIAAGIQQRSFKDQFSEQSLWLLAVLAVMGLLVGYWLGGKVYVQQGSLIQSELASHSPRVVGVTRLQAILSFIRLRGKGIQITDVLSFGSKIDIDTTPVKDRNPRDT